MRQKEAIVEKYSEMMKEVRQRTKVIDFFIKGEGHALYAPTTTETICLQLRKILELIAFGSLIANEKLYQSTYENFAKHYNAKKILADLERINPDFYPVPVIQAPSTLPGCEFEFKPSSKDYLTKDGLIHLYEKCGQMMHAKNPYGKALNYEFFEQNGIEWRNKVVDLLSFHQLHLAGESAFLYTQMAAIDLDNPLKPPEVQVVLFELHE